MVSLVAVVPGVWVLSAGWAVPGDQGRDDTTVLFRQCAKPIIPSRGFTMLQQSKGIRVLALAAVVALAAGCASNSSVQKAQSTADEALRTAQEAKQTASSAQQTAAAAKSAADAASAKADKSQACCNEVQSKLDRVFERSQRK